MRRSPGWIHLAIIASVGAALTMSCDDDGAKPTAPLAAAVAGSTTAEVRSSGASAGVDTSVRLTKEIGAQAISYPDSQVVNTAATALRIEQSGSGRAAWFEGQRNVGIFISHGSPSGNALGAITYGPGDSFYAEKTQNGGNAILAYSAGNSNAGQFQQESGNGRALLAVSFGSGLTLQADNHNGSGGAASFNISGTSSNASTVLSATTTGTGRAGFFRINNTNSSAQALRATTNGVSQALFVERTSGGANATAIIQNTSVQSNGTTLVVSGAGGGTALRVNATGPGAGLIVNTAGGTGLAVVGGAKNAVVRTSSGARALYAEESSEVWFSDYGFGQLKRGRARVALDRTFAETVNLTNGYHVFVQSYGDAELVVRGRSSTGFEVVRRHGDEDAEFSYRIVAKRRGFDHERLARAPWADSVVRDLR